MPTAPLKAIVVGAGHRAMVYASYAQRCPEALQIVGVADPIAWRRRQVAERYGFGEEACFEHASDLAAREKFADFVINGTMDRDHVPTTIPLLEAGYDVLLEKPFCTSEAELWDLLGAVRKHKRQVAICHVLRYAPFYATIRQKLAEGAVGRILNIQTTEHVSYHHMAVGFVRGKWNSRERCQSSMLMAKCCHDLDLLVWLKSGIAPVSVSSFGGRTFFCEAAAPAGAGTRCLVDCPIEESCLYSARKHYIDHPERWSAYVWQCLEEIENPTIEQKIASLKGDNPHGRCVWRCDNDVVDHQSLVVDFADGATATHNMIGGTSKPSRSLHIIGSEGEIQGCIEDSRFVVRHIDPRSGHEFSEEIVDLNVSGDMHGAFGGHGGGDLRLVADFVSLLRGESPSLSCTHIEDSVYGHLLGFRADQSMQTRQVMDIPQV